MAAFFKCKVGGKAYELPKLTLGEARILKRDFGLDDLEYFNPTDPDHLTGLLYLCLKREKPDASHALLLAEVESLDVEEFEQSDPETKAAPDPQPAVSDGGEQQPDSGSPETTPASDGNPL